MQAVTNDTRGRETAAYRDIWVAGKDAWWFQVEDSDRIDLIPEKKRYEPGETARFQVRMPFREATALVSIEREGTGEAFVRQLSGNEPVIEIPIKGSYAPNVFLSVLVVRGRVTDVRPTATVDLGRPAFKLGIAAIDVGWRAHELKVKVSTDRKVYQVRRKAKVKIEVQTADGKRPPAGSEVAVAAVDEGLLELMPNSSWDLLEAMMGPRGYGVMTSTAQMHVVGKRHFGLKALPQGGGGGRQNTRELFDTLLLWQGRVRLDRAGRATVEVPLNDSVTSFRITAVATGGAGLFGTGSASIRSMQDLVIFSGIPPVVRQGDTFRSSFTVRNATDRRMDVRLSAGIVETSQALETLNLALDSGESREIGWDVKAPAGYDSLTYEVDAAGGRGASDRLSVSQKVVPAVPVRAFQATISQLTDSLELEVERPQDALPGRGGIRVVLQSSLLAGLAGIRDYMDSYPYTCLEQLISKAVARRDLERWNVIMEVLPAYIDADGLARYFPSGAHGSETLTSYILAIAHEAGWQVPADIRSSMLQGLRGFVEGRIIRRSSLPTADLAIRKIAAIEAISRYETLEPRLLSSTAISPNLWPTSAVIDWYNILHRAPHLPGRAGRLAEVDQILRARLSFQGTTMGFSTERSDYLWWLMVSTDSNAVRFLLRVLESPAWQGDIPRLVRGALDRQRLGCWSTTVANAWGVLAMEKFAALFEKEPVTGQSVAVLHETVKTVDWGVSPEGATMEFAWPEQRAALDLQMKGTGRPWAAVRSLAAVPLREPLNAGFTVRKTVKPVEQKEKDAWNIGDIVRVSLELES
ncbi:MAG: alpha-2-macroglobulin, partial [Acidobacteria bacterium]|nr:alpha-2-macroglobulin [Acidobacteriota bacterium]